MRLPRMVMAVLSLFRATVSTTRRSRVLMVPALYWLVLKVTDSLAAFTASSCTFASSSRMRRAARLSSTSWKPVSTVWR